jgi:hypothetical protein
MLPSRLELNKIKPAVKATKLWNVSLLQEDTIPRLLSRSLLLTILMSAFPHCPDQNDERANHGNIATKRIVFTNSCYMFLLIWITKVICVIFSWTSELMSTIHVLHNCYEQTLTYHAVYLLCVKNLNICSLQIFSTINFKVKSTAIHEKGSGGP